MPQKLSQIKSQQKIKREANEKGLKRIKTPNCYRISLNTGGRQVHTYCAAIANLFARISFRLNWFIIHIIVWNPPAVLGVIAFIYFGHIFWTCWDFYWIIIRLLDCFVIEYGSLLVLQYRW